MELLGKILNTTYHETVDKVTGMSYEEFLNSDGVIFNMSNMKYDEEIGWDKEYCSAYDW